jgi:O-antigen/teichoic acid export membrane protein
MKVVKRNFNQAVKSEFFRNVSTLAVGTAAGQALLVLVSPILSRIYSPAEFGIFGAVLSLAVPLTTIGCFKYSYAVVLEKENDKAANILVLCALLVLGLVGVNFLLVAGLGDLVLGYLEKDVPWHFLLLVPLIVFIEGISETTSAWANRFKRYRVIAANAICRPATTATVQIALGLAAWGAMGLILGRLLGVATGAGIMLWRILRFDLQEILAAFDWSTLKEMAYKHRNFAIFSTPRELMVALSGSLPSILLVALFSPEVAGAYWFTVRLMEMPANVVGQAVRKVAYQKLTVLYHDGADLFSYVVKMTLPLLALSLPVALVIVLFGPELFSFVFGKDWLNAGVYARFIVFWSLASFCNAAISSLIAIYGLQKHFLLVEALGVIFRILGFVIAYKMDSALLAVVFFAFVGFALNFYRTVFLLIFAKSHRHVDPATD